VKLTHTISVVIDHNEPIGKRREDARIAARSLFDEITGGATQFLIAAAKAENRGDRDQAGVLMAQYRAAKLCPEE
jgi:hypothetical protein